MCKRHFASAFASAWLVTSGHCAWAQRTETRNYQLILSGSGLYSPFDLGIDTYTQKRNWLFNDTGEFRLAFPGDAWGAFFVTVGTPTNTNRPGLDLSAFDTLEVELRTNVTGRTVQIGMKDNTMPDDGSEPKQSISLTTEWQVWTIPFSTFRTLKTSRVYVPLEIVFDSSGPLTVYLRNARVSKSGVRMCQRLDPLMRAWWPANNNYRDVVNGNDGRLEGNVQFTPGISDLAFNVSSGTLIVSSSPTLKFAPTDSFTVDLWYKRLDPVVPQYILGRADTCSQSSSTLQMTISDTDFPSTHVALGSWNHLALVLSGGVAEFYVNGVRVNRRPMVFTDSEALWRIGGVANCSRTNSIIDEVAITGRALTSPDLYDIIDRRGTNRCNSWIDSAVNSASLQGTIAPDSLTTFFGSDLSGSTVSAGGPPLQGLGGVSGVVRSGTSELPLQIYYASPGQVNAVIPRDTPMSSAVAVLRREGSAPKAIALSLKPVAPGLFTASGDGKGVPAGTVLSVSSTGQTDEQPLFTYNAVNGHFDALPIALPTSGQTYFVLYGTGFRNRQTAVTAMIGDQPVAVQYAGDQHQYAGLDQINLGPLPAALAGKGVVSVQMYVDGIAANPVSVNFR